MVTSPSAFAVGQSERSIAAIDADGIPCSNQGLSRDCRSEIPRWQPKAAEDAEVADLKRLAALEALVQALQARQGANE